MGTILFCVIFLSFQVLFKRNSYHSDFNSAITAIRSFEGSSYEYSSHYILTWISVNMIVYSLLKKKEIKQKNIHMSRTISSK